MKKKLLQLKMLSPFKIITFSFLILIVLGSLLLYLPISAAADRCSYLDALFTASSAVCVTGLVVHNTATFWSGAGKGILLLLIQIGGLGVITVVIAASIFSGQRIGLRQRSIMQSAVNAPKLGGIIRFTRFLLFFTFFTELAGALLLLPVFLHTYGIAESLVKAVFHAVSAFCNAGFDLMGEQVPFSSLTAYAGNAMLNIIIMLLIIMGGLGFLSWEDLLDRRFKFSRLRLQTKLVLVTSAVLIFVPAVLFFVFAFPAEPLKNRVLMSLFQSVTTRTAGFNTAPLDAMPESARMIMILLMLIGGSPGSTAGGMKTTTFAVVCIAVVRDMKRKKTCGVFGRSVPPRTIQNAFTLFCLYLFLFMAGSLVVCTAEQLPLSDCMFECASALGTVGLTTGITPKLGSISKVILILFMYFGRVGGLTLAYAALSGLKPEIGKAPEEPVMIG